MESNIKDILVMHHDKYPLMQIEDVIKLIYQSILGCGHIIPSKEIALINLKEEVKEVSSEKEFLEDIGNGYSRLYFGKNSSLDVIANMLFLSSMLNNNDFEVLEAELKKTCEFIQDINFSFSKEEFDSYLNKYQDSGYPMTHHSEIYRNHYNPHYRVIKTDLYIKELL